MTGVNWYEAAAYCNWLSGQEELPKDQRCYLSNETEAYAEGMSIPADVLERTGYRLPTEAEWEYACRAGAVTGRFYGQSIDLLGSYARYRANSKDHAWTCGSLFSNDLGLFDMLGNMYEWCQDGANTSNPGYHGLISDIINTRESIGNKNPRFLRGGSFDNLSAFARSAPVAWSVRGTVSRPAASAPRGLIPESVTPPGQCRRLRGRVRLMCRPI